MKPLNKLIKKSKLLVSPDNAGVLGYLRTQKSAKTENISTHYKMRLAAIRLSGN